MPIYEYQCEKCGERFELRRSFGDSGEDIRCPKCGARHPKRILSAFASTSSETSCAPSPSGG